jgi:uncharacterized protein YjbI with pentapeptide repeats
MKRPKRDPIPCIQARIWNRTRSRRPSFEEIAAFDSLFENCEAQAVSTNDMKGRDLYVLLGFIFAAAICLVLWLGYVKNYAPIGFSDFWVPKSSPDGKIVTAYEFQRGRTLWDWMQLLVVPALLFVAGYWFNKKLKEREATVALNTERAAALQKYFDAVADLITKGSQSVPSNSSSSDQQPSSAKAGEKSAVGQDRKAGTPEALNSNEVTFALQGLSLNNVYLKDVDLRGADLRSVDLKDAFIDETTLIDKKWQLVWKIVNNGFVRKRWDEEVNLSNADLAYTCLNGAELGNFNLEGADLRGATFDGAHFEGAKIDKKTRIDSKWSLVWKLANDRAGESDPEGRDLSRANLQGLRGKKSFREADISQTDLSFAVLDEPDFRQVIGSRTVFNEAEMTGAKFSRGILLAAEFKGAKLPKADFSETSCSLCKFNNATLTESNFRKAELWDADLSDADLSGADLTGADLTDANLSRTKLEGAVLTNAKVTEAQLANAIGSRRR